MSDWVSEVQTAVHKNRRASLLSKLTVGYKQVVFPSTLSMALSSNQAYILCMWIVLFPPPPPSEKSILHPQEGHFWGFLRYLFSYIFPFTPLFLLFPLDLFIFPVGHFFPPPTTIVFFEEKKWKTILGSRKEIMNNDTGWIIWYEMGVNHFDTPLPFMETFFLCKNKVGYVLSIKKTNT